MVQSGLGSLRPGQLTPQVIGRAIDSARWTGPFRFIMVVGALGFFFDLFDNSLLAYALPSISQEFQLRPEEVGLVASASLIGMAVGSFVAGWIADRWGRAAVFATTVLVFALFTGLSAVAYSVGFLIGARFLAGTGLGGTVPVDMSLLSEYAPARLRGRMSGALPFAWPVGAFAAAAAGLLIVPTLGWRWLFLIGIVPALITYLVRRGVPESPRWLVGRGRVEEARRSLAFLGITDADLAQAEREVVDTPVAQTRATARIADLFTPLYAKRVVHTWLMWFFSGLAAWGFSFWLPTLFTSVYHIALTRTLTYTLGIAAVQVVGRACALSLVDRWGRRPVIVLGFVGGGVALWLFNLAQTEVALVVLACLFSFFSDQGAFGMTVYTPEVYPLWIRGIGTSWAMGVGRIAGALGPFTIGLLVGAASIPAMWWLLGACQIIAGLSTLALGIETRGLNLELTSELPDEVVTTAAAVSSV